MGSKKQKRYASALDRMIAEADITLKEKMMERNKKGRKRRRKSAKR